MIIKYILTKLVVIIIKVYPMIKLKKYLDISTLNDHNYYVYMSKN